MKIKLNIYLFLGLVSLMLTWLFVGLSRDTEFYDLELFIKYRPTFKLYFYSPLGMSDLSIVDLLVDEQSEEIAFRDFIFKRDRNLALVPFILLQLTLSFLICGYYKLKVNTAFKFWQFLTHFFINLVLITSGIVLIFYLDELYATVILLPFLIFINYLTLFILRQKRNSICD